MTGGFSSANSVLVEFDDRDIAPSPPVPLSDSQLRWILSHHLFTDSDRLASRPDLDRLCALAAEQAAASEHTGDLRGLMTAVGNHAVLLQAQGDLDGPLGLLARREAVSRQADDEWELARTFALQAAVRTARGDLDEAVRLREEAERIHRRRDDVEALVRALLHRGALLADRLGQPRAAIPLLEEAMRLVEQRRLVHLRHASRQALERARGLLAG